jgi:hypothetical protein
VFLLFRSFLIQTFFGGVLRSNTPKVMVGNGASPAETAFSFCQAFSFEPTVSKEKADEHKRKANRKTESTLSVTLACAKFDQNYTIKVAF